MGREFHFQHSMAAELSDCLIAVEEISFKQYFHHFQMQNILSDYVGKSCFNSSTLATFRFILLEAFMSKRFAHSDVVCEMPQEDAFQEESVTSRQIEWSGDEEASSSIERQNLICSAVGRGRERRARPRNGETGAETSGPREYIL